MKVYHKNSPFFHIQLENIFSNAELTKIKNYFQSLEPQLKSPEFTESAENDRGEFLKKNVGIFVDEIEGDQKFINDNVDKILKNVSKSKWSNLCYKRFFHRLQWGSELIQSYKDSDYYKPHSDFGVFTMIIWLYNIEESVTGGDLYFPEYDHHYSCKNNHGIIFLSPEMHGVTPVQLGENNQRFSLTTFSTLLEEKDRDKKFRSESKELNLYYN